MHIEKHKERMNESIEVIDECISKDINKRQRTLGFSISAASADMFEIFLHNSKLVDPGFIVKHEWFKSKNKVAEKFHFEFKNKKKILELLYEIEVKRNLLCYGSPQSEDVIKKVLAMFNEFKTIIKDLGVEIE